MQTPFYRALERAQRALCPSTDHARRPSTGAPPPGPAAASRPLARRAQDTLEHLLAESNADATPSSSGPPTRTRWACRAGCAHCCHHPVGVTFAEAAALAFALQRLPPAERVAREARVHAAAADAAPAPWSALAGRPCPLLAADGACVVYADRPLACRAWASTDAAACASHAAGVPVPLPFDEDALALGLGVAAVLAERSVPSGHRELRAALAALLGPGGVDDAARFAAARPAGPEPLGPEPAGAIAGG
ncbi:MAG: YkgJ family cysteine cluster protein [Planctomycetota bacterium]